MPSTEPVPSLTSLGSPRAANAILLDRFEKFFQVVIEHSFNQSNACHSALTVLKDRLFDFIRMIRDAEDLTSLSFQALRHTLHIELQQLSDKQFFAGRVSAVFVKWLDDCFQGRSDALITLIKANDPEALLSGMRDNDIAQQQLQAAPAKLPAEMKTSSYTEHISRLRLLEPDNKYTFFFVGLQRIGKGVATLGEQESYCRQILSLAEAKDADPDPEMVRYVKAFLMGVLHQQVCHLDRQADVRIGLQKINEAIAIFKSLRWSEAEGVPRFVHLQLAKARLFEVAGAIPQAIAALEVGIVRLDQATEPRNPALSELQYRCYHIISHLLFLKYLHCEEIGQHAESRSTLRLLLGYRLLNVSTEEQRSLVAHYQILQAATYEKEAQAAMGQHDFKKTVTALGHSVDAYFQLAPSQIAEWGLFGRLESISNMEEGLSLIMQHDLMVQEALMTELQAYLATLGSELQGREEKAAAPVTAFFKPVASGSEALQCHRHIAAIQQLILCLTIPIVDPEQRFFAEWEKYKAQFALAGASAVLIKTVDGLLATLMTPRVDLAHPEALRLA